MFFSLDRRASNAILSFITCWRSSSVRALSKLQAQSCCNSLVLFSITWPDALLLQRPLWPSHLPQSNKVISFSRSKIEARFPTDYRANRFINFQFVEAIIQFLVCIDKLKSAKKVWLQKFEWKNQQFCPFSTNHCFASWWSDQSAFVRFSISTSSRKCSPRNNSWHLESFNRFTQCKKEKIVWLSDGWKNNRRENIMTNFIACHITLHVA